LTEAEILEEIAGIAFGHGDSSPIPTGDVRKRHSVRTG
jgi:hypothetical protein